MLVGSNLARLEHLELKSIRRGFAFTILYIILHLITHLVHILSRWSVLGDLCDVVELPVADLFRSEVGTEI